MHYFYEVSHWLSRRDRSTDSPPVLTPAFILPLLLTYFPLLNLLLVLNHL